MRDPLERAHPWCVLIEAASQSGDGLESAFETMLEDALERGLIDDAALAANLAQRDDFWRLREFISDSQKFEGGSIKHDVSVPVGAVPEFIAEATAATAAFLPGARVVAFGHMGDGNIHFNVSQPVGADTPAFLDRWEAMNEVVHAIVARYGGSFSAEHGIGQLKRDLLRRAKGSRRSRRHAPHQGRPRSRGADESGKDAVGRGRPVHLSASQVRLDFAPNRRCGRFVRISGC